MIRTLLSKIILWALRTDAPEYDPAALDRVSRDLKAGQ